MARNGKSISVKIATSKVIKALETKLALAHTAKATDLSANVRYNGEINIDFNLPAGTIVVPEQPEKDYETYHDWQYREMVDEIENAIRILKMTDEEVVSTSTYNAIARYL